MSHFKEHEGKQVVPLWINGKDQPVKGDHIFEVIHAATAKTVHHAQSASQEDATTAVAAAAGAFRAWSTTSIANRRAILNKVADLLEERAEELGAMQALETSCAPGYGRMVARVAVPAIREIAAQITAAFTGSLPPDENATALVTKQPIGPILCISPWNSPTILGPRAIASALAAGCTVVLKASELSPQTYRMICQIFSDAGIPDGVLNQVTARREDAALITETIISNPAIRKVEFIGSTDVGSQIGQLCSRYMKPIAMECGGKGPVIVRHDANLARSAAMSAFGAFVHHGQICMSTERIIVVKQVAEEFSRLLKAEVEQKWLEGVGSAATRQFANKAHQAVESARAEGAEFLVGENLFVGTGSEDTSLQPTILTKVGKTTKIRYKETFGPSATLYVVEDDDEALELANDCHYGLVGCIWTRDVVKGIEMAKRLECGVVGINDCTVADYPTIAMQGMKGSGWSSCNSVYGILEFLQTKTITLRAPEDKAQFQG